ncbi:hypothetical protein WDU94_011122 [Cyamophila willieti]
MMSSDYDPKDPCSGVKTKEDLDKWTDNIHELFKHLKTIEGHGRPEARERFKATLENDEEAKTDLFNGAKTVVEYANEHLNFTFKQIELLENTLSDAEQNGNLDSLRDAFDCSLTDATDLLKPQYKEFRKTLLDKNSDLLEN